jgi:hypothetical protein
MSIKCQVLHFNIAEKMQILHNPMYMSGQLKDLNVKVNDRIESYLAMGGTLADLSDVLGINLSTLWRYRRQGFKDPYSVYLIAKSSGQTEDDSLQLAKEVCIANGGNPDGKYSSARRRSDRADVLREQIRALIQEELSKITAKESA